MRVLGCGVKRTEFKTPHHFRLLAKGKSFYSATQGANKNRKPRAYFQSPVEERRFHSSFAAISKTLPGIYSFGKGLLIGKKSLFPHDSLDYQPAIAQWDALVRKHPRDLNVARMAAQDALSASQGSRHLGFGDFGFLGTLEDSQYDRRIERFARIAKIDLQPIKSLLNTQQSWQLTPSSVGHPLNQIAQVLFQGFEVPIYLANLSNVSGRFFKPHTEGPGHLEIALEMFVSPPAFFLQVLLHEMTHAVFFALRQTMPPLAAFRGFREGPEDFDRHYSRILYFDEIIAAAADAFFLPLMGVKKNQLHPDNALADLKKELRGCGLHGNDGSHGVCRHGPDVFLKLGFREFAYFFQVFGDDAEKVGEMLGQAEAEAQSFSALQSINPEGVAHLKNMGHQRFQELQQQTQMASRIARAQRALADALLEDPRQFTFDDVFEQSLRTVQELPAFHCLFQALPNLAQLLRLAYHSL